MNHSERSRCAGARVLLVMAGSIAALCAWPSTARANVTYSYPGSICVPSVWDFLDPDVVAGYLNNNNASNSFSIGYSGGTVGNFDTVAGVTTHYGFIACPIPRHRGSTYLKSVVITWVYQDSSVILPKLNCASEDGVASSVMFDEDYDLPFSFSATPGDGAVDCVLNIDPVPGDSGSSPFQSYGVNGIQVVEGN